MTNAASEELTDNARLLMSLFDALKPEHQQIIMLAAETFAESNGLPPIDDGPEFRNPRPSRKR